VDALSRRLSPEATASGSGKPHSTLRGRVVQRACLAVVLTVPIVRVESVAMAADGVGPLGLLPTLPLPTLPLPTLPLPTVPVLPLATLPVPTLPVPTLPVPTVPVPTLPLPSVPVPSASLSVPTLPLPSSGPTAGASAGPSEPASAGTGGPAASGGAPGASGDPLASASPVVQPAPGGGTLGALILPALIAGIPLAIVALILAAQTAGGAAWLTVVRRWLNRGVIPASGRARR
jgi:hypothetical protein